jgi:hypothetical protein
MRIIRLVCVSDRGQRVGEDAAKAKLTNEDARMIRVLHYEHAMTDRALAEKYEVSRRCIRDILACRCYPETYRVAKREIIMGVDNGDQ